MKKLLLFIAVISIFGNISCNNDSKGNNTGKGSVTHPKNILFIAVDDLKPILGCYGETVVQTPNIDKLASQGFVLKNNHCQ